VAPGEGYHGYQYKILTAQGKDAPGGVHDYVIGGRMRAGFALVAWPIQYGDTGVTSFVISHEGVLYQKDREQLASVSVAAPFVNDQVAAVDGQRPRCRNEIGTARSSSTAQHMDGNHQGQASRSGYPSSLRGG